MTFRALQRGVAIQCLSLALLAGCGWTGASAQAAPSGNRPLFTGLTGIYDYNEPAVVTHIKAAGTSFVRVQVDWVNIAPRQEPSSWQPTDPGDPNYDWRPVDLAVTQVSGEGLTPVLSLDTAPPWAQGCTSPNGQIGAPCDPNAAALGRFATAMARRYSGSFGGLPRVRYWQGMNEPNLSLSFNPQFEGGKPVSPVLYRRLINSFYAAIKSVDDSNLVLSAGLGPIAVPGFTVGPMSFTRTLLCMTGRAKPRPTAGNCEGGVHFDIFDTHPYTTGGPTHEGGPDDVQLGDLGKLQDLLRAADRAGRIKGKFKRTPLWVTELSWDSNPPDPGGLPISTETRWTAEAMYRAWRAGVSHIFWFRIRDDAPNPQLPHNQVFESGLYFRGPTAAEDQPKEYFYAFRFPFVAFHPDKKLTFWGRTPTSRGGRVAIQVMKAGGWRTVARTRAGRNGIFQGAVVTGYGSDKQGSVRAKFGSEASPAFSMRPVADFYQPPFG